MFAMEPVDHEGWHPAPADSPMKRPQGTRRPDAARFVWSDLPSHAQGAGNKIETGHERQRAKFAWTAKTESACSRAAALGRAKGAWR